VSRLLHCILSCASAHTAQTQRQLAAAVTGHLQCVSKLTRTLHTPWFNSHIAASVHRHLGRSGKRKPGLGKSIALDIARGLAFLHTHRIVHLVSRGASTAAIRVT
jgi:hypothetical protein